MSHTVRSHSCQEIHSQMLKNASLIIPVCFPHLHKEALRNGDLEWGKYQGLRNDDENDIDDEDNGDEDDFYSEFWQIVLLRSSSLICVHLQSGGYLCMGQFLTHMQYVSNPKSVQCFVDMCPLLYHFFARWTSHTFWMMGSFVVSHVMLQASDPDQSNPS